MDEKPSIGSYMSMVGGGFVLLGGILVSANGVTAPDQTGMFFGILGVVSGSLMILGGYMMYSDPEVSRIWGAAVLILSFFSWITSFGGFFIGFLLGLIGGVVGIAHNRRGYDVMKYLVTNPTELNEVFASYDKMGLDGVAGYMRERDPNITGEEADAVAIEIIAHRDELLQASKQQRSSSYLEFRYQPSRFPGQRPTGVSILSVLQIAGGLLVILLGGLLLGISGQVGSVLGDFAATFFGALGAIFVVSGGVSVVIGYGMWTGRSWAWLLAIIFAIIGLIAVVVQEITALATGGTGQGILAAFPDALILYYLRKPNVRSFFGRGEFEFGNAYTNDVMSYLAAMPAEADKLFATYDQTGLEGIVDFLRARDPDLTSAEASVVAHNIVERTGRSLKDIDQEGTRSEAAATQEHSEEKSWIDKWLQR